MSEILTVKLRNGVTVLAKMYEGSLYAMTFANRTQAANRAAALGPDWEVRHFGRPFWVVKKEAV